MTEAFTVVEGAAIPLMLSNVNTDVIIRVDRLTTIDRERLGLYAFEALRTTSDGETSASRVLNSPTFREAPILLASENFGCGSSREAAVWALRGMGIRCVVAPSYGDIFKSNCFQNGVLPVELSLTAIKELADSCRDGANVRIDLATTTVTGPNANSYTFDISETRRRGLMLGLDDVALTLTDDELISEWQKRDRLDRPWAWINTSAPRP